MSSRRGFGKPLVRRKAWQDDASRRCRSRTGRQADQPDSKGGKRKGWHLPFLGNKTWDSLPPRLHRGRWDDEPHPHRQTDPAGRILEGQVFPPSLRPEVRPGLRRRTAGNRSKTSQVGRVANSTRSNHENLVFYYQVEDEIFSFLVTSIFLLKNLATPPRVVTLQLTKTSFLCPWQESDLHQSLRRASFYPLNYKGYCPALGVGVRGGGLEPPTSSV